MIDARSRIVLLRMKPRPVHRLTIDMEKVKSAKLWLEQMARGQPTESHSDRWLARYYGRYLSLFWKRLPAKYLKEFQNLIPLVSRKFPAECKVFIEEVNERG